jgi:hypothetical protein
MHSLRVLQQDRSDQGVHTVIDGQPDVLRTWSEVIH